MPNRVQTKHPVTEVLEEHLQLASEVGEQIFFGIELQVLRYALRELSYLDASLLHNE